MVERVSRNRTLWLMTGIVVGLCISQFWPHEPVQAGTADRDTNKVIMVTTPAGIGVEGVFVLNQLTGTLSGAVLNPAAGRFTLTYLRNIAADFPGAAQGTNPARYTMVAGQAPMTNRAKYTPGLSVIYIAETISGRVNAYSFPYTSSQRVLPTATFQPMASFPLK